MPVRSPQQSALHPSVLHPSLARAARAGAREATDASPGDAGPAGEVAAPAGPRAPWPPLPPLPADVRDKWGQPLVVDADASRDGNGDVWVGRMHPDVETKVRLDFAPLRAALSDRAVDVIKLFVADAAEGSAAMTLRHYLAAGAWVGRFVGRVPGFVPPGRRFEWSDLSFALLVALVGAGGPRLGRHLSSLRLLVNFALDPEHPLPDFDPGIAERLELFVVKEKRASGADLADPRAGAFDRDELEILRDKCRQGHGDPRDRALVLLLLDTGLRPIQVCQLRVEHLVVVHQRTRDPGRPGPKAYWVRRPVAKRPDTDRGAPDAMPITAQTGELLEALAAEATDPRAKLFPWLRGHHNHAVAASLLRFWAAADPRSPRLPVAPAARAVDGVVVVDGPVEDRGARYEPLPVHPYRFRYAMATDMLNRGHSVAEVAAALGHADTRTVRQYAENSPAIGDEIARATDWAVSPLVRRMRGRLDDPAAPADRPAIPGIVPPHLARGRALRVLGPIGKCDHAGLCPKNPVVACFTCDDYIARPDGAEIIRELRADFVAHLEGLGPAASDVTAQQLRQTIAGMTEWIDHIEAARAEVGRAAVVAPGASR